MNGYDVSTAPTLQAFLRCNDPHRLTMGPVGSGKTSACSVEILRRSIEILPDADGVRRSRWAVIRNTYRELEDTTINTFSTWIPDPQFGTWSLSDNIFHLRFELDDGTRVEADVLFRALDKINDAGKLLSLDLTGCYFNELREIPRSIYDLMDTRVGRYPPFKDGVNNWFGIWSDTNAPDRDHWIYKLWEEERPVGYSIFKQPSGRSARAENRDHLIHCPHVSHPSYEQLPSGAWVRTSPTEGHLTPCICYYEKISRGKSAEFVKIYVDSEYGTISDGRPVFPEFSDRLHVAEKPIETEGHLIILGIDFGLTPAAVFCQVDETDGQIQVLREFISSRMGALPLGRELLRICRQEYRGCGIEGWGDPAGMAGSSVNERETPISVISALGVPVCPAPSNDLTLRWDSVRRLLTTLTWRHRPGLVISPNCRMLRAAMGGKYELTRLAVRGDDRYRDAPLKNEWSHVAEALQYALLGLGEGTTLLAGTTGSHKPNVKRIR